MAVFEMLIPFVALSGAGGKVTSIVPPVAGVMVPTVSANGFEVAFAFKTIALAPELTAKLAKVWAFVVLALPVRVKVPPPSCRAELADKMFEAGEVACVKSKVKPPRFSAVAPV